MKNIRCLAVILFSFLFLNICYSPVTAQNIGSEYKNSLGHLATNLISEVQESGQRHGTVLDFTDLQGQGTVLGRFLAIELSDQIVSRATSFSLIDRANFQHLLRENKLSLDGFINHESRRKIGNMIGIDTVISGSVTPIGSRVRLSVRAISVETGKIVSAQSVFITATQELLSLYGQGLDNETAKLGVTRPIGQEMKRFRRDSIKLVGKYVRYQDHIYGGSAGENTAQATAFLMLENLSGFGFEAAFKHDSAYIETCSSNRIVSVRGIKPYCAGCFSNHIYRFKYSKAYIPANAKIPVILKLGYCRIGGERTVSAGFTLTIEMKKKRFSLPLSAARLPVR